MPRRAVLFDIDGTLLSTGGAGGRAMHTALGKAFGADVRAHNITYAGRCDRGIFGDLLAAASVSASEDNYEKLAKTYLECLKAELHSQDATLLPGVSELLDVFSGDERISMGLLTGNLERGASLKLGHFNIEDYFEYGGFGDAYSCRNKLAESMLPVVAKSAGIEDAQHIWVIGDTPADVECARAMGAKCVAVATGMFSYNDLKAMQPDYVFENLSQCQDWSQQLLV